MQARDATEQADRAAVEIEINAPFQFNRIDFHVRMIEEVDL